MERANPVNVTHIDHVVLRVEQVDLMIRFYVDVLGFRLERGPGDIGLAQLRAGSSLLDLVDVNGPLGKQGGNPPDHGAPNMDHVCFQVRPWDSDAILGHLRSHQVERGRIEHRYGAAGMGPSIYLKDPEGNQLELKGT
ncbi:MAG: VOC family protein [Proteobacteria bacterium]|jgi:glyoxylase I family protein|nr:VOC family protein [Pseudomonadota bacterium]MDA1300082.1 VOC family protein [Pseudomonadota bacterium]